MIQKAILILKERIENMEVLPLTIDNFNLTPEARKVIKSKYFRPKMLNDEGMFYELCFAMCSPQVKWESNQYANALLRREKFHNTSLTVEKIDELLIKAGLRFHNNKAKFLVKMKEDDWFFIPDVIKNNWTPPQKRNWLSRRVKGFGMKTSSHFLKNLGFEPLAVIDTHICKFLKEPLPKNRLDYLRLERLFYAVSQKVGLTCGELDSFIWAHYSKHKLEEVR